MIEVYGLLLCLIDLRSSIDPRELETGQTILYIRINSNQVHVCVNLQNNSPEFLDMHSLSASQWPITFEGAMMQNASKYPGLYGC